MYGILFRDINMKRTLIDQHFSRLIIALSRIVIHTGEDNYLTTADAIENGDTKSLRPSSSTRGSRSTRT